MTPVKRKWATKLEVLLTVPNMIGYVRIALAFLAFYYAFDQPLIAAVCYSTSYFMDALDGVAARRFNQSTELGAVLDMVTDRFCDACILVVLSNLYTEYRFVFICLLILDFTSHWVQMYSTLKCGEAHHKTAKTKFWLLRFYYSFPILLLVCLFAEVFLVGLYVQHFSKTLLTDPLVAQVIRVLTYVSFPIYALKQIISVVQLVSAVDKAVELDWVGSEADKKK